MRTVLFKTSIFLFTVLLFSQYLLYAEWEIIKNVDSLTDEETKNAELYNDEGYTLGLCMIQINVGKIKDMMACNIFLPTYPHDTISPTAEAPIYRVDKNKAHDLNDCRVFEEDFKKTFGYSVKVYIQGSNYFSFLFTHPNQAQEFAKGKKLLFRYWLSKNSSYKETTFFISGADKAISEILKSKGYSDDYLYK